MMKNKQKITTPEVQELLQEFLQEVENASRRYQDSGSINYPYATGCMTSALRSLVLLATVGGGKPAEVVDALKYEIDLLKRLGK